MTFDLNFENFGKSIHVFIKGDHKRMLGVFNLMWYVIKVVYD